MKLQLATLGIGLIAGLLYFGHAMINNSHAWPLVWPLVAGCAVVVATMRGRRAVGFWKELGFAVETGAVAGVVFFAASAVALSAMGLLGGFGLRGLAVAAMLGVAITTLAGAITFPIARRGLARA